MTRLKYEWLAGVTGFFEIILIFSASVLLSRIVDGIAHGSVAGGVGLVWIAAYAASVYLSTVMNILAQRWIGGARVESFATAWNSFLPRFVPRSLRESWERFFVVTTEQIPRARELRIGMIVLVVQIVSVQILILARSVFAGRYELVLFALVFAGLNVFANRIHSESLQQSVKSNLNERSEFLSWHRRYFAACAGLVRHWRLRDHAGFQAEMVGRPLLHVRSGLQRTLSLRLQRLAAKSVLCDLPFYLGICYFLSLGANGTIGLGAIFFWLTMNELLFRANGAARELMDRYTEWRALQAAILPELERVRLVGGVDLVAPKSVAQVRVQLQGGGELVLCRTPGLHRIMAANGSGKSHLLRFVAGEEFSLGGQESEVRALFSGAATALVTPEFETLGSSRGVEEIFGPRTAELARDPALWPDFCTLPESLAARWWELIHELVHKYPEDLGRSSSGEKALLSLARALTFMDRLEVVLVDEVDTPLSEVRRELVHATVAALAQNRPVYMVSHQSDRPSFTQHCLVLGYSAKMDEGMAVHFLLRATVDGRGRREASGGVAGQLLPLLELALETLVAADSTYGALAPMSLNLECQLESVRVTGVDSAGLAMALALVGLKRRICGERPLPEVSATGQLDLSGRVFPIAGLEKKRAAAARLSPPVTVIGPDDIEWVSELESFACAVPVAR